jgi:hypothetical protein
MPFLKKNSEVDEKISIEEGEDFVFSDLKYTMEFTKVISALKQGCDITQLSNGDTIISQTKVVHTHLKWDPAAKKFVKFMQYNSK